MEAVPFNNGAASFYFIEIISNEVQVQIHTL
jgi:hypothetical protein